MKNVVFLILLMTSLGVGMTMTKRIIDDIYLVYAVGYDYVDDNRIRGTVAAPIFKESDKVTNMTFSEVSSLIYENREKLESEASKPLYSGKLEIALYNSELAKKGIIDFVDNLQRDPEIGTRVNLAIAKDNSKEMLSNTYEDMTTGKYLSDLIEQNTKDGNLPMTNLKIFITNFYSKGKDPILPVLKEKGDKIKIDGIAIFKKDKVVDTIPFKDVIYLKMLVEDFDQGIAIVKLDEKRRASISNISSDRKFIIKNQYDKPEVTIILELDGFIREYSGTKMSKEVIDKLAKKMQKDVEQKTEEMINNFQELGADPVGIGEQVRRKTYGFDMKKWDTIYPTVDIKVKAKVDILEHGVIN